MINKNVSMKVGKTTINHIFDDDPDYSYLEQPEFKERFEQYKNDEFCFIGIRVKTQILTSYDKNSWLINEIQSGGLWGTESDSGDEYFKEIAEEEKEEVKTILLSMGFNEEEIEQSFKDAEEVDR